MSSSCKQIEWKWQACQGSRNKWGDQNSMYAKLNIFDGDMMMIQNKEVRYTGSQGASVEVGMQKLPEDTVSPDSLRSGYNCTLQRQLMWHSSAQGFESVVQSSFSASRWEIYIKIGISGIVRSWEYFYNRKNNTVPPYLNGISCSR